MGSITTEQHNMTRRAVKARRRKTKKAGTVEDVPLFQAVADERLRSQRREEAEARNRKKWMDKLKEDGEITIRLDDLTDLPLDTEIQFHRDMRDIKAAIKSLPFPQNWKWRWKSEPYGSSGWSFSVFAKTAKQRKN